MREAHNVKHTAAFGCNQILLVLLLETGGEQEHEQEGLSAVDARRSSQESETSEANCVRRDRR